MPFPNLIYSDKGAESAMDSSSLTDPRAEVKLLSPGLGAIQAEGNRRPAPVPTEPSRTAQSWGISNLDLNSLTLSPSILSRDEEKILESMERLLVLNINLGVVIMSYHGILKNGFERSNHQLHFTDETGEVQSTTDSTF